jgi:ketosteroid isomerase-like protein
MDAATTLQAIYQAYREKRLADILPHLDEDFRFVVHLPEDALPGGDAPRDKAQAAELVQQLMDNYDFLAYDPGPIIAAGNQVTAQPLVRFRDKRTGKVLETRLGHTWQIRDGKFVALDERHDVERIRAFFKSLAEDGA